MLWKRFYWKLHRILYQLVSGKVNAQFLPFMIVNTHTTTRIHSLTLTFTRTHALSNSYTVRPSQIHSQSHIHTDTYTPAISLSHSRCHIFTRLQLAHTYMHAHICTYAVALPHSFTDSHICRCFSQWAISCSPRWWMQSSLLPSKTNFLF
jgi:hypothetical protein